LCLIRPTALDWSSYALFKVFSPFSLFSRPVYVLGKLSLRLSRYFFLLVFYKFLFPRFFPSSAEYPPIAFAFLGIFLSPSPPFSPASDPLASRWIFSPPRFSVSFFTAAGFTCPFSYDLLIPKPLVPRWHCTRGPGLVHSFVDNLLFGPFQGSSPRRSGILSHFGNSDFFATFPS